MSSYATLLSAEGGAAVRCVQVQPSDSEFFYRSLFWATGAGFLAFLGALLVRALDGAAWVFVLLFLSTTLTVGFGLLVSPRGSAVRRWLDYALSSPRELVQRDNATPFMDLWSQIWSESRARALVWGVAATCLIFLLMGFTVNGLHSFLRTDEGALVVPIALGMITSGLVLLLPLRVREARERIVALSDTNN